MMNIKILWKILAIQLLAASALVEADIPIANKVINENKDQQAAEIPTILNYSHFLERFKRIYNPLEATRKAKLFLGRTLEIFKHNTNYAKRKTNYFLAQNEFTDLTPEELVRRLHVGEGNELEPVAEAAAAPDVPASSLLSVQQLGQSYEGFSRSTLSEIQPNGGENPVRSSFDFASEPDDESLRVALQHVNNLSERDSKKLEEVVNMKYKMSKMEVHGAKSVDAIEHKTIVKSNNRQYDPLMTTSYGIWEELELRPEHYTKFGLDDLGLDLKLDPYPKPEIPNHKVLVDEEHDSFLSGFLNAIKDIYNGMDDYDELLQDEWVNVKVPKKEMIAYDIDWRTTGCITQVKEQKSCNSCYAFTVIGLMEYFYCRQTKKITDFSVQYVVDCGSKNELRGCKGGKITNVGRFIRKFGIELNAMYPYNGSENQCPVKDAVGNDKKVGYLRPQITKWQNFPDMVAWFKWLPKSPLIVGINMPNDFLAYGGGVHDGSNCQGGKTHAMLLVGSGKEGNNEFWLLKNSYSDMWGEDGYFRLSKSAPLRCFNSAIVVRASFNDGESS